MSALAARLRTVSGTRGVGLDAVPPLVLIAITCVLLVYNDTFICPDVSGQFILARAMRHGARLYTDYVEPNPPLWFWLAMPVDYIAETLDVRTGRVMVVIIALAVLAAVGATARLLPTMPPVHRMALLTYVVAILLFMPAMHIEQREHIALIGAVPYLMLAAARRRRDVVPPFLAAVIGAAAGLGFALKPYFLGLPLLVEIWLIVGLGRGWRPFRPETIALASVGVGYAVAFLVFAPQYLTTTIPLLLLAYSDFGPRFLDTIGAVQLIWVCVAITLVSQHRVIRQGTSPMTVAFVIGFVSFALSWGLQHKGWLYQALPATGCLALALAALLVEHGARLKPLVLVFAPALLLLPFPIPFLQGETKVTAANDIAPALADLQAGDAVGIVSTFGLTAWPASLNRDLRLSSRYGQFWILDALQRRSSDPDIVALAHRMVRQTAFDYRCLPPKVIVFVRFARGSTTRRSAIDPYPLFVADPQFARVLSQYRLWKVGPIYDAYRPIAPIAPLASPACRHAG